MPMTKFATLVFTILFTLPCKILANPIDNADARQKAMSFLTARQKSGVGGGPKRSSSNLRLTPAATSAAYHAFNVAGGGFVIMSASDRTQEVLGYSDSGTFNLDNAPEAFKAWMAGLSDAVKAVEAGARSTKSNAQRIQRVQSVTKNYIPTLVSARWNQGDPYNQQCPTYTENGETHTCATGCVATAMAQIMYFWKWPVAETGTIPAYTTKWNNSTRTYAALPSATFAWDDMTDTYNSASSAASKRAVAELMRYVGQSIEMGYGPSSGASASATVKALKKYFGYDSNLYYANSDDYNYEAWQDLIYNELAAGRPVLMNGDTSDRTGGHEWVCDGYDGDGLFHMNWGWGGMSDGYFILTVMQPDHQGIGGSTSSDGYSMGQGIVVGLQPATGEQTEPQEDVRISLFNLRLDKTIYTRKSVKRNFYFPITYSAGTNLSNGYQFDAAFTLYDAEGNILKETIGKEMNFEIQPGTYWPTRTVYVTFGQDLPNGTYFIKGRSRKNGDTEWNNDDKFDKNFIKAVISEMNNLSLTVYPAVNLTVNSLELIGTRSVGTEQKVKVNITNNDATEYYRDTYLLVDGSWVSGNCIQVASGSTGDYYFKYTPAAVGNHTFALSTSKDAADIFYSTTVSIGDAVTPNLSLTLKALSETDGNYVYGNEMRLQLNVKNNGTSPYMSYVEVSPWKIEGNYYWKKSALQQDINLAAGRDTTLVFTISSLDYDGTYNFHAEYNGGGNTNLGDFTFKTGILYWTADGTMHGRKNSSGFTVTKDMSAVSVPGASPISFSVADNFSPNTIFYFDANASLGLRMQNNLKKKGVKNIVYGNKAENFVANDSLDFYAPQAFTATSAQYVRTIGELASEGGWSTLTLPFAAQTVSDGTADISWFTSDDDTGKSLVVKEFAAIDGTRLYFDHVEALEANRPYLICLAGTCNSTAFDNSGKTLTFSAIDATVEATQRISTYSSNYKYVGTTSALSANGAYLLNSDGTAFVQTEMSQVSPFRAYFVANNKSAAAAPRLVIDGATPTAIHGVTTDGANSTDAVYTIGGVYVGLYGDGSLMRSLPKGVYIIGNRKYVSR